MMCGKTSDKMLKSTQSTSDILKGYDCCRRQTDMAWRYPDDDPLRHMSSHSVTLTVGLSLQRHHQHEIPVWTETSGVNRASDWVIKHHVSAREVVSFTSGQGWACPSSSCYLLLSRWSEDAQPWPLWPALGEGWPWEQQGHRLIT